MFYISCFSCGYRRDLVKHLFVFEYDDDGDADDDVDNAH